MKVTAHMKRERMYLPDSPYRDFFKFNNEHEWPYNPYYDGWWGHDTLPKLNYEQSHQSAGVYPPYCGEMAETSLQRGWLETGCGGRSWLFGSL